MRPFLRRILLCTLPCLLAALLVGRAYSRFQAAEGGVSVGEPLPDGTLAKSSGVVKQEGVLDNPDGSPILQEHEFETTRTNSRDLPLEIKRVVDQTVWERMLAALQKQYPALRGKLAGL